MAARLDPRIDQRTRDKIKTVQLVHRLQGFALGEKNDVGTGPVMMSRDQITAAIALLKKTLPDLSSVEMSGDGGGPVIIEIRKLAPDVPPDA